MTDMQPKKMIILDILQILKEHTDEDHRISIIKKGDRYA